MTGGMTSCIACRKDVRIAKDAVKFKIGNVEGRIAGYICHYSRLLLLFMPFLRSIGPAKLLAAMHATLYFRF